MASVENHNNATAVLCVDDDPVCLMISQKVLRKNGWKVMQAGNVSEARALIEAQGCEAFACVLTDYSMPGETGLDLLAWIKSRDESLAVILVTGKGDRETVRQSLREGVFDFLDKPIPIEQLPGVVARAAESTKNRRHLADRALAVEKFSTVHEHMMNLSKVFEHPRCRVVFRPLHEAGGDFLSYFKVSEAQSLFLLADVSGHDLKDAYLSAVFQGYLRGLMERGAKAEEVFSALHSFLVKEWNSVAPSSGKKRQSSSLALCSVLFDRAACTLTIRNAGQPPGRLTISDWTEVVGFGAPPLGWFEEPECDELCYRLDESAIFHAWTDGFDEFAAQNGIDPMAAVYRMLHSDNTKEAANLLSTADDDILILQIDLSENIESRDRFFPVIVAKGDGSESEQIDGLVEGWGRSLDFSKIPLSEAARFDIMLCARETALNAIRHGCRCSHELTWGLQIHYNPATSRLRLSVRDSGQGYDDTYLIEREADDVEGRHCGLVLLKKLGENIRLERRGAWLTLELPTDRPM